MTIEEIRRQIAEVDDRLMELIARRQELAGKLAVLKYREGQPIVDERQRAVVLQAALEKAVELQVNPEYVQEIFKILIEMSEERQRGCSGEGNLP
ncbi:MAG: chorismate mutase [Methanomicrobiales archaeon]|nr:chorismate mutase [Methanomicrobiales archaeon]